MAKKKKKRSKKKGSARKKKSRKKGRRKKAARRSNKMPIEVIKKHAKSLKKNKRAADVYRDVLGCR